MTKNWREVVLNEKDTLEKAISIIDSGGKRIAIVLAKDDLLLGTVTDGDIRRGLLNNLGMDIPVSKIMNANPVTAKSSDSHDYMFHVMKEKDLLHLPVLDKNNRMIGLETISHLLNQKRVDNPVLLMAGGFGKRLKPLTNKTPKPLLKIGSKPIIEIILSQFISEGFHDFYISTHYKADMLKEHFGDGSSWGVRINYVHEDTPLGTAGALGLLKENLLENRNLPIIMMNGDLLTKMNFLHLLKYHSENGGVATVCAREYTIQVPYGVIIQNVNKVSAIEEKPLHKFLVNAGIYVISCELMNTVTKGKNIDVPKLLELQIEAGKQVNIFPLHEYWLDIGYVGDYKKANGEFSEF